MRRRNFCRGLAASPFFLAAPYIRKSALAQEVSTITLIKQHGLGHMPFMVMEELRLVEKYATKAGLPSITPVYRTMGGTSSLVDSLISGQMHFGITGVPALTTLWSRTAGTPNEVRGLCSAHSMPFYLVTHRESVKTLRDFTDQDKIALPSVKVSAQAVCLQMAVAKEWGFDNYAKLDHLTVTRAHPDAVTAIITKSSEITAHYTLAPFHHYALATPGVHTVIKSYDVFGGPKTNGLLLMSKAFGDANPKVTNAVYEALQETEDFINKNPRQVAEIYIKMTNEKRSGPEEMTKIISDPDNVWTATPSRSMQFAEFMHKVGTMKRMPDKWQDMFMPQSKDLKGS